jgi:hypothetical protein
MTSPRMSSTLTDATEVLGRLVGDPDVNLDAISALRRTVGNEAALPVLRGVRDSHPDPKARRQAARAVAASEKSAAHN